MFLYILQRLLHAGISREAAIHRQADASDETGCIIVQQEQQRTHKVFFAVAEVSHGGGGKFRPWLNLYNVRTQKSRLNLKNSTCLVVAGAGFEPTTFGL